MTRDDAAAVDALARLLDGTAPARDLVGLAALAQRLELPAVTPRAEFRADLRRRLIAEARAQAAAPTALARIRNAVEARTARWRYSVRLATATGIGAMALSSGGVAAAAERSLPGDPFYGVKLLIEDVQLWFTPAPVRGERHVEQAIERVREAQAAAEAGDEVAAVRALEEARAANASAAQAVAAPEAQAPPAELGSSLQEQRTSLSGVADAVSAPAAEKAVREVLETIERIEASVPAPVQAPAPQAPVPASPVPALPVVPDLQPAPAPAPAPLPTATSPAVSTDGVGSLAPSSSTVTAPPVVTAPSIPAIQAPAPGSSAAPATTVPLATSEPVSSPGVTDTVGSLVEGTSTSTLSLP